jgi:hypothetical protein
MALLELTPDFTLPNRSFTERLGSVIGEKNRTAESFQAVFEMLIVLNISLGKITELFYTCFPNKRNRLQYVTHRDFFLICEGLAHSSAP